MGKHLPRKVRRDVRGSPLKMLYKGQPQSSSSSRVFCAGVGQPPAAARMRPGWGRPLPAAAARIVPAGGGRPPFHHINHSEPSLEACAQVMFRNPKNDDAAAAVLLTGGSTLHTQQQQLKVPWGGHPPPLQQQSSFPCGGGVDPPLQQWRIWGGSTLPSQIRVHLINSRGSGAGPSAAAPAPATFDVQCSCVLS